MLVNAVCTITIVVSLTTMAIGAAAEQVWEVRGALESITSESPQLIVLRLSDGTKIEFPLESLSRASQALAREQVAGGPLGSDASVNLGATRGRDSGVDIAVRAQGVEADALKCDAARQAIDVYRLYLAGQEITPDERSAAEARMRIWKQMSDRDLVRLGDRWVSRSEASEAAAEADKMVAHALELMRLGNADLAEGELLKASRIDPSSCRASFIAGLAYGLVARNPEKAVEYFFDVVDRAPYNSAALNNLAIADVLARRHVNLAKHFQYAVEYAIDPQPVVENLAWAVRLSGAAIGDRARAKYRMPNRVVDELNAVYRAVTQEFKLKPVEDIQEPRFLGPDGVPCVAMTLLDVGALFADDAKQMPEVRRALGFVVAANHVLCPRHVLVRQDGSSLPEVMIESPKDRGKRLIATVVVAPEDGEFALLRCDGLDVKPLSLADTSPVRGQVYAVDRTQSSWLDSRLAAVPGVIEIHAEQSAMEGRFVHTAIVPRGPGGGPIVDVAGRAVGMVAATPRTDASGNTCGFGIPVSGIRALVSKNVPSESAAASDDGAEPSEVAATAVESTVFVVATTRKPESVAPAARSTH